MFTKTIATPTVSTAPLTLELGMEIYWKLMELQSIDWVIKLWLYDPENIIKVNKEVDRMLWARGKTEMVSPAEYTTDPITMDTILTKEAEYQEIPVTSEFLDVDTIFTDFPLETNVE